MKKQLAFLMTVFLLCLLCACGGEAPGGGDTTPADTTAAPIPEVLPVDLSSFSMIRAEKAASDVVSAAADLYAQLRTLEGAGNIVLLDDFLMPGASADSAAAEILFGLTNRPESAEALAALPGYLDFSVGKVGEKICIAANTTERLADAAAYFLDNLSAENGVLQYTGGQYVDRYAYPLGEATLGGVSVKEYTIVYPAGAATEQAAAERLSVWFAEQTGSRLPVSDDSVPETAREILLGKTSRAGSVDPETVEAKSYHIRAAEGKLILSTASAVGYNAITNRLEELMKDNQLAKDFTETAAYTRSSLDGARVMFVGNSFTYYGSCTGTRNSINPNDNGYFRQVARAMGDTVTVTSVTYGGAVLRGSNPEKSLYDILVTAHPNHYGADGEMDDFYAQDVVIIQQAGENPSSNEASTRAIMALFPPETQFCFFIHHHNVQRNHTYVLNTAKTLRDEGSAIYLPVGHLIHEVWTGKMQVPGATLEYNQDSFCVNQENDRHHPNYLNGYLTALTVYYALTGRSVAECPHDFVGTGLQYYKNGATSNYPEILASDADMAGLKQLVELYVDQYN